MRAGTFGLAALACIASTVPAYSQNNSACTEYAQLRTHAKKHFAQIKGTPLFEDSQHFNTTFKLAGSGKCEIDLVESKLSRYSCTWFVSQGKSEGEAAAKKAFELLLTSVVRCVPPTDTLERGKKSAGGEWGSILDTYPGLRSTQIRVYEVSYRFQNHWWAVELEYEINDDFKP